MIGIFTFCPLFWHFNKIFSTPYEHNFWAFFLFPLSSIADLAVTLLFSTDDKEEVSAMINFHIILSISINILIDYEKEATDMFYNFLTYIFLKKFHKLERVLQNNKI